MGGSGGELEGRSKERVARRGEGVVGEVGAVGRGTAVGGCARGRFGVLLMMSHSLLASTSVGAWELDQALA